MKNVFLFFFFSEIIITHEIVLPDLLRFNEWINQSMKLGLSLSLILLLSL